MKFEIRKATKKDLESFFSLFSRSLRTYFPEYSDKTVRFFLEKSYRREKIQRGLGEDYNLFLAFEDSELIGYLLSDLPYGGVAFCSWIAVSEPYRKKGVGTALLKAWEEDSKRIGAHKLRLGTSEEILGFYKKNGFELIGKIPKGYFGTDDFLLYKKIAEPKEENFVR